MKIPSLVSAALFSAVVAFVSPGMAAPLGTMDALPKAGAPVTLVSGCHSDVRRHYVPEFGRSVSHRHQRNCRPVRVNGNNARDCHRDARRHFVPGYGRVVHRHVGSSCRVRILHRYDRGGRNCVQIGPIRYCER